MNTMKKLVGLSLAASTLVGCTATLGQLQNGRDPILSGAGNDVVVTELQDLYEKAYTQAGKNAVVNQILTRIAELEIASDTTRNAAYINSRVDEKLLTLAKGSTYKVDNVFSEERLVTTLRNQGFTIATPTSYSNNPEALNADYSDYKTRKLRQDVLLELLNEEYVLDEYATLFEITEIREVEYFYLDAATIVTNDEITQIQNYINQIRNDVDGVVNLADFANAWKTYRKNEIDVEAARIGTTADANKTIENKYTNSNSYPISYGVERAKANIDAAEYYTKKIIINTDSTFSLTVKNKLFASNVASTLITIGTHQYFPSPDNPQSIYVSDNSRHYVIRAKVIDENSTLADKQAAAIVLAKTKLTTSTVITHYLTKYSVSIHEEDLYDYIKETYGYPAA